MCDCNNARCVEFEGKPATSEQHTVNARQELPQQVVGGIEGDHSDLSSSRLEPLHVKHVEAP